MEMGFVAVQALNATISATESCWRSSNAKQSDNDTKTKVTCEGWSRSVQIMLTIANVLLRICFIVVIYIDIILNINT